MSRYWQQTSINENDIIGKKFGKWTVLKYSYFYHQDVKCEKEPQRLRHFYLCRCKCGKERIVQRDNLIQGASLSCGCNRKKQRTKK